MMNANTRYWLAMTRAEYHLWAACKGFGADFYALRGPKCAANVQRIRSFDRYETAAQRLREKASARYWLSVAQQIRRGAA